MEANLLLITMLRRAGHQCEADKTVRGETKCCDAHHLGLVVAPRDARIDPASATAARLPLDDLAVWCKPCLTTARNEAEKAARRITVIPGQTDIPTALNTAEIELELLEESAIITGRRCSGKTAPGVRV